MPDLDLDELAAVAEAATPGPWEFRPRRGFQMMSDAPATIGFTDTAGYFVMLREGTWATENDMNHVATFAPEAVLALIAEAHEAERLRREVSALADRLQVEADSGRDSGHGHPLLVQTYANHARDLRALIGGER